MRGIRGEIMKNYLSFFRQSVNMFVNTYKHIYNPYIAYKKIKKQSLPMSSGDNILIVNVIGAYSGHIFEGLYARKAMLHGTRVGVLFCGNYLSHCEAVMDISTYKSVRCACCQAQQEEFAKAFGVDVYNYGALLTDEDERQMQQFADDYFRTPNNKHYFLEVKIEPILYSALQRYYLIAAPAMEDTKVTRGFLRTILATLIMMDKLEKRLHFKYVLSSHGTYSAWGAAVAYCQSHGIYVITYGQNYNKSGYEFTYDASYLTGDLEDRENLWAKRDLSVERRKRAVRFLDERLGRVSDENVAFDYNKNNKTHYNKTDLYKLLNIPHEKKIVGLFPNIPWDGQVTGTSAVFSQFRDWLKTTVDYFAKRDDAYLIIRSHPAEALVGDNAGRETTTTMLQEMYGKLPENIILLHPKHKVNSYTLGENVEFGIAYSTTLTMELTYLGIPVILCGCPPFKNKGIGFDISSIEHYLQLLDDGLAGKLKVSDERKETLFKFIDYFFFMRTMPQTLVEVKDCVPLNLLFNSEAELDADPVFDDLYKHIESKEPMDFSRFWPMVTDDE